MKKTITSIIAATLGSVSVFAASPGAMITAAEDAGTAVVQNPEMNLFIIVGIAILAYWALKK